MAETVMAETIPEGYPTSAIVSERAWDKSSDFSNAIHEFSDETQEEVAAYVKKRVSEGPLSKAEVEAVEYDPNSLPLLVAEIEKVRPQVDTGIGFVVFPAWKNLNVHQSRVASWLVDNAFGEAKIQDDQGSRLIEIYNVSDSLSMKTGARYHETREGNSPHTDSPQVPSDPDYLCLRCVCDALVGGENILVTMDSMYNYMLKNAPEMISVLTKDFFFHRRGVVQENGAFFPAPILSKDSGGLRMRFLDHYITRGHELSGNPLTPEQTKAIHYLNSLFEISELQFKATLLPGQQVVFANKRMLHARTEFTDRNPATEKYDPKQLDDLSKANRLMDRSWSFKRNA